MGERRQPGALLLFATALVWSCGDANESNGTQPAAGDGGSATPAAAALAPGSAILLTMASARLDGFGFYGSEQAFTPYLDELAKESLVYEQAHTAAPLTLPSHTSMITGLYPVRHQVRSEGIQPLHESARTLAELASENGVQTAAILGARHLAEQYDLDQGFDHYDAPTFPDREYSSPDVVKKAQEWLAARDPEKGFFLWIELDDPRRPHQPPPEIWDAASPYLGEVTAADRALEPLLRTLREDGVLDDAFIVFAGAHGEALEEHDETSHGRFLYETTLRVPLFLRYPDGHRAGERSDELVSLVDLHGTLAEAMGFAPAPDIDGQSLFRRSVPADRGIYFETIHGYLRSGWSPLVGWMDSERKFVHGTQSQFFDLAADPTEETDLFEREKAKTGAYRDAIAAVAKRARLPRVTTDDMHPVIQRGIYRNATGPLTLLDVPFPEPLEETGLPGPILAQQEIQRTMVGLQIMSTPGEAEIVFRDLFAHNPLNPRIAQQLAICLIQQHRHSEAVEYLELVLEFGPASVENNVRLGICMRVMEQHEKAVEYFEQALFLNPDDLFALGHMGATLEQLGRKKEAASYAERYNELRAQAPTRR